MGESIFADFSSTQIQYRVSFSDIDFRSAIFVRSFCICEGFQSRNLYVSKSIDKSTSSKFTFGVHHSSSVVFNVWDASQIWESSDFLWNARPFQNHFEKFAVYGDILP